MRMLIQYNFLLKRFVLTLCNAELEDEKVYVSHQMDVVKMFLDGVHFDIKESTLLGECKHNESA